MKRKLFLSLLIVFFTMSFISLEGCTIKEQSLVSEITSKENDELQEKCEKMARESFEIKFGTGRNTPEVINFYDSHYNKKLNKCFSRETTIIKGENNKDLVMIVFSDLTGSFIYGVCYNSPDRKCTLQGENYPSKEKWNTLVKHYMEE